MNVLARGNLIMPPSVLIYSHLRLTTCAGATKYCLEKCYAKYSVSIYANVRERHYRNYILSLSEDFIPKVCDEIEAREKKSWARKIRIHEVGDYYSQEYLNKWIVIARRFPDIIFLSFTRTFHLWDFNGTPPNMIFSASFDNSTPIDALKKIPKHFRRAYLNPPGVYTNGAGKMIINFSNGQCGTKCLTCWKGEDNVQWATE